MLARSINRFVLIILDTIWRAVERKINAWWERLYDFGEIIFGAEQIVVYTEEDKSNAPYIVETKVRVSPGEMIWEYQASELKIYKWASDAAVSIRGYILKIQAKINFHVRRSKITLQALMLLVQKVKPQTVNIPEKIMQYTGIIKGEIINFIDALKNMLKKIDKADNTITVKAIENILDKIIVSDEFTLPNKGERRYIMQPRL